MAQPIKGPGLLYVKACINPSPSNPLTEPEYMHWYDDDHIAEIVATSGMPNAFRYFHVDKTPDNGKPTPECPRPYLAFYPMPDLAFTQGQEFKSIRVKSRKQAENVSKLDHYQRSLRFRLLYARTNAQSRILKGLAPATDEPLPEPPTWLQFHEFSAEPQSDVRSTIRDDAHEVLKNAKQSETHGYRLQRAHGKKKFFEDAENGAP
ncbi:uncharacterized protein N0V89_003602 [Didymosphaeria variabile]|uniref:Uncharacterized protein n=1 Tax=Didymosphaeria variabile TaxID=1932322 RepID=A0A9W8XNT8_9PLEO|nr:uncharacterized protein N0V89_003602 [Didymosphaeria variabile]KAJ4355582.1 hypothetical protein N0V89_003602 [Didymosphaeria variabile]